MHGKLKFLVLESVNGSPTQTMPAPVKVSSHRKCGRLGTTLKLQFPSSPLTTGRGWAVPSAGQASKTQYFEIRGGSRLSSFDSLQNANHCGKLLQRHSHELLSTSSLSKKCKTGQEGHFRAFAPTRLGTLRTRLVKHLKGKSKSS